MYTGSGSDHRIFRQSRQSPADEAYSHPMRAPLTCAMCLVCAILGITSVEASDLVLVHARVYPSPGAAPLDDATIAVHNDRVASLSQATSKHAVSIPLGATVIDCTGMSVTAGLWNSHVHILPVVLLHADVKTGPQLTSALQELSLIHI